MKTKLDFEIIPYAPPAGVWEDQIIAIDSEFYGMDKKRLHRPSGQLACITATNNGKQIYICQDPQAVCRFLDVPDSNTLVMQKAYFDIIQLRRYFDLRPRERLWDTMLVERILYSGWYDRFSLQAMARRYLNLYMEKETRNMFQDAARMTDEMIFYSCQDCAATWLVAQKQMEIATERDRKCWFEVDLPALWPLMEFKGFPLDKDAWAQAAIENEETAAKLKAGFPFNPNAPGQVKDYLRDVEGIKKGLESTDEDHLIALNNPMGNRVLAYRKIAKQASTYGMNWIEEHLEPDGCIYCEYDISGAETGRMSSSNPDMQNIPVRNTKKFRNAFIALPGQMLISGDFSQQEPRLSAFWSQDQNMIQVYRDGKDIYLWLAPFIYGEEIIKDDPRRSNIIKPTFLGLTYGLSAFGLARDTGLTEDEAQEVVDCVFVAFPILGERITQQKKKKNCVYTLLGRKFYLNSYTSQCPRNAINSVIQGSAAEVTKKSMARLYKEWPRDLCEFGLIAVVHDEFVAMVPEQHATRISLWMRDVMVEEMEKITPGIPAKVDVKCGKNWGVIH